MTLIGEVTSRNLITAEPDATCGQAAQLMRDGDVGDVIVIDAEQHPIGIVTDRDLVVRVLSEDLDPYTTRLGDVCTGDPVTISVEAGTEEAEELMSQHAIRRLPVVDGAGVLVGVVSLGDLAVRDDPQSALADISQAPADS